MCTHKLRNYRGIGLMRTDQEILQLIANLADSHNSIEAVLLNGSRANPVAKQDVLQDFDLSIVVDNVEPFVEDQRWLEHFGEILISQIPDLMDGNWPNHKDKFTFLVLFADGNRIDFNFIAKAHFLSESIDSLSKVLCDKTGLFNDIPESSEKDYLPTRPSATDFANCVNEFLWVSTYVGKGLWRQEIVYAKYMLEQVLREELLKILSWQIGYATAWQKNLGSHCRFLRDFIDKDTWVKITASYVDEEFENNWTALLVMLDLFNNTAIDVASHLVCDYDSKQYERVKAYLIKLRADSARQDCRNFPP